ncbi:ER membrane protein complex subunit 4 isoform X1 [Manis javanica]
MHSPETKDPSESKEIPRPGPGGSQESLSSNRSSRARSVLSFPGADVGSTGRDAVKKYQKLGGLKQQKYSLSQLWKPEDKNQCWGRSDRGGGLGDSLYPVGYLDKQVPDTSVQETDRILVEKRCWDIALGPLKQIPMNLFIMYMAGNTISIFPTMMVCMMAWRPIQALMAISATFKMLESSSQKFLQGLVYLIGNLMGLALAVYKCQSMGLLPTHASDWLAFIEPPERMEFSGGGLLL